ncbi:MAG: hypothetical protein ACKO6F_07520, partial [Cyanobium sp.]
TGNDTLTGGTGNDRFTYTATNQGGDIIIDFNNSLDKLVFTTSAFGGITTVTAGINFFSNAGGTPTGINAQFLYNTTNGLLSFDTNGTDTNGNVSIATLSGIPALLASGFQMV